MEEPEYDIVAEHNPCYHVTVADSKFQDTAAGVEATGVKASAEKPARPCSWVCIGLILVGVVACVSMAVSVWSIVEVHNINNSFEARNEDGETVEQVDSDRIEELNATFIEFLNSTLINIKRQNDVSVSTLIDMIEELNSTLINRIEELNVTLISDEIKRQNGNSITTLNSTDNSLQFPTSCLQLFLLNSSTPSGYYWVTPANCSAVRVYCDMTRSCGGVTGGWMRVAGLDFSDTSTSCPSGLRECVDSGIRTCGIESLGAACPSVMFSTSGVEYTKVCGKVIAYQNRTTDAFGDHGRGPILTIDSNYVDGVILTHGHTPRNHIWTFVAALDESGYDPNSVCRCSYRTGKNSPSFIEQDYFCDSGSQQFTLTNYEEFFVADPLWDGAGCGSSSTCCSFNNPPWFHKELPSPTSDDIEMRVCSDQIRSDEDIAMSNVEIYVQ